MIKVGDMAPDFALPNQKGVKIKLSDFLGNKVVIYFYTKDDSPKCTKQACSFRDNFQKFKQNDIVILGISFDNYKSHKQFIEKFSLPFQLLSDNDTKIATKYGIYGEKIAYGRKFMGIQRTTFIVDEQGIIIDILKDVKPLNHAVDVLEKLSL